MIREVRLYIEGGGDGKNGKSQFRQAFGEFLREIRALARENKVRWEVVACGSREATFDAFTTALKVHRAAFNVLLVDSETAITLPPWRHLEEMDRWRRPIDAQDRHCHFMAQAMEAWLLADESALAEFYGKGFNPEALPKQQNVEQIAKAQLTTYLNDAARGTNKSPYHKIRHACRILERTQLARVCHRAPYCRRFVETLKEEIGARS